MFPRPTCRLLFNYLPGFVITINSVAANVMDTRASGQFYQQTSWPRKGPERSLAPESRHCARAAAMKCVARVVKLLVALLLLPVSAWAQQGWSVQHFALQLQPRFETKTIVGSLQVVGGYSVFNQPVDSLPGCPLGARQFDAGPGFAIPIGQCGQWQSACAVAAASRR